MRTRGWSPRIVAATMGPLLCAMPRAVWACPACYSGGGDGLLAYFWTAVLLSALPLAMIGGLVITVRRRIRAHRPPATATREVPAHLGPAGPSGS